MIEEFIRLMGEADDSAWIQLEWGSKFISIDGYFDVKKIESWLHETKLQAVREFVREHNAMQRKTLGTIMYAEIDEV